MGVIAKVVRLSMPYYVPILECGHAGDGSTDPGEVPQAGQQIECLECSRSARVTRGEVRGEGLLT